MVNVDFHAEISIDSSLNNLKDIVIDSIDDACLLKSMNKDYKWP